MASGWHRKDPTDAASRARAAEYRSPRYKATRAAAKVHVESGAATCWRCGKWIPPGSNWHLGHDDNDRRIIRGPEHAIECNLKAAASKGARVANANRKAKRVGVTALSM